MEEISKKNESISTKDAIIIDRLRSYRINHQSRGRAATSKDTGPPAKASSGSYTEKQNHHKHGGNNR